MSKSLTQQFTDWVGMQDPYAGYDYGAIIHQLHRGKPTFGALSSRLQSSSLRERA